MEKIRHRYKSALLVAILALLSLAVTACGGSPVEPSVSVTQTLKLLQKDALAGSITNADSIFAPTVSVKDTSTGKTETYTRAQMVATFDMLFSLMKFTSYTFAGEIISVNGNSATIATTRVDAWTSKVDGSKQTDKSIETFSFTLTGGKWLINAESYASAPAVPKPTTYAAYGSVTDASGAGVAGVTITVTDSSGKTLFLGATDANGRWTSSTITGDATVTPSASEWTFTPTSAQVSASNASANFTATPELGPTNVTIQSVTINTHVVSSGCSGLPGCTAAVYSYDGLIALTNSGAAGDCKTKIEYDDGAGYWQTLASGYASTLHAKGATELAYNLDDVPEVFRLRVTVYTDESGSFVQTDQVTKAPTN